MGVKTHPKGQAMAKKITISFNEGQWAEVVSFFGYEPAPNDLKTRLILDMNIDTPDKKAGRPKLMNLEEKTEQSS